MPIPAIASVLVVCDGNHCRSPIGEALLKEGCSGELEVSSAGLTALEGVPPAPEAQRLLRAERGLDISGHRGRQVTPALVLSSDLILVMEERQRAECERLAPSARGRVFLLGHWQPPAHREIPDPFRKGPQAYRKALEQISQSVRDWLPRLVAQQRSS